MLLSQLVTIIKDRHPVKPDLDGFAQTGYTAIHANPSVKGLFTAQRPPCPLRVPDKKPDDSGSRHNTGHKGEKE